MFVISETTSRDTKVSSSSIIIVERESDKCLEFLHGTQCSQLEALKYLPVNEMYCNQWNHNNLQSVLKGCLFMYFRCTVHTGYDF